MPVEPDDWRAQGAISALKRSAKNSCGDSRQLRTRAV